MQKKIKQFLLLLEKRTPGLVRLLVRFRALFAPLDRMKALRGQQKLIQAQHGSLAREIEPLETWEKTFQAYLLVAPRNQLIFESFMTAEIQPVSRRRAADDRSIPLALCVVKNDLARLEMVISHHRQLGIRQFAVLDNGSDDGTLEWLKQQPDIDVYSVKAPFLSLRKYGWINRLLAMYGFDRWYLYVDSDECLVYPGHETKTIDQLTQAISNRGLDRLGAVMLDMYSDQELYSTTDDQRPIAEQYCYFDADSFELSTSKRGPRINGGPRKRVFSAQSDDSPLLIKFPLFYLRPGMVFESAHYLYPFKHEVPVGSALLHYKFLASDLARHRQIAENGSFQGGSREYKRYLSTYQEQGHLTFMYPGSVKYEGSSSLERLGFVANILDTPGKRLSRKWQARKRRRGQKL